MGGEKEKSIIFNVEKSFLSFLVLFFKFYLFIYFGLCWVFAAACRLSLAAGSKARLSSCGEQASHCCGFPCCGARALGPPASVVVAHALICSMACGPSPTRDQTHVPCFGSGFSTTEPPGKSRKYIC